MSNAYDFYIENGILKDYTGTDQEIVVPDGVTEIGFQAFYRKKDLISVKLPKSLKSIGRAAFRECGKLEKVSFSKSVERIGDHAFFCCGALTEITQPTSKTEIGYLTFAGCGLPADQDGFVIVGSVLCGYKGSDEHVTVPDGIKRIGEEAFADNNLLTTVTLPEGLEEISCDAFTNCKSLMSVTMPDTVTKIGNGAFLHCTSLFEITLPESIKTIEDMAFFGCDRLADDNGFLIVRGILFNYLHDLSEIAVPDSVSRIGTYAFYRKHDLKKVTLPDSVKSIGLGAFEDCENLAQIDMPENPIMIEDRAFKGCRCFADEKGFIIFRGILYDCLIDEEHVEIPLGVTRIGSWAFLHKENLISVTVQDGLKEIANDAFCDCPKLKRIFRK